MDDVPPTCNNNNKKRKILVLLPHFNVTYLITMSHAACVWCTVLFRSTCGPCNSKSTNQKMCVKEEASSKNRYLISAAAIKCVPLFRGAEKNNAGVQLYTKVKSSVKKIIQNVCAANTHRTHFHFLWRGKIHISLKSRPPWLSTLLGSFMAADWKGGRAFGWASPSKLNHRLEQ